MVEEFFAWKFSGRTDLFELPARTVDAFILLENEWLEEKANGEQRNR
jgi:hypothetical protein